MVTACVMTTIENQISVQMTGQKHKIALSLNTACVKVKFPAQREMKAVIQLVMTHNVLSSQGRTKRPYRN